MWAKSLLLRPFPSSTRTLEGPRKDPQLYADNIGLSNSHLLSLTAGGVEIMLTGLRSAVNTCLEYCSISFALLWYQSVRRSMDGADVRNLSRSGDSSYRKASSSNRFWSSTALKGDRGRESVPCRYTTNETTLRWIQRGRSSLLNCYE